MADNLADQMKRAVSGRQITVRKIVGYGILFLIAIVFVFYGFLTRDSGSAGYAAIVSDHIVTLGDLERENRRIEAMYRQIFGGNMDLSSQRQMMMQEALQSLVNQRLVSQAAQKAGFMVSDQEVVDFIVKDYPAFQVNGVFQRNLYYDTLQSNKISPVEFEDFIRTSIEGQRSRQAFEWVSAPNKLEKEKQQKLKETQVILSYISIQPRDLESKLKASPAEVERALADASVIKRAEDEYKARKNQFDKPEQVKAQHILVKATPGDVASEKNALAKIQELKAQTAKTDFGGLAEKNSDDPGSKVKKGDLGYFSRGQMVPEFDEMAFKMKVGEISEPIKTQFGYHLIKLNDKKAAVQSTFEEHKKELVEVLIARDKIASLKSKAQEVFDRGESAEWMKSLGVSWKETAAFDLGTERVPELTEKVMDVLGALVSDSNKVQVLSDGEQTFVVKLKELKPATAKPTEAKTADNDPRARANELFSNWVEGYKKTVKIEINPQIMKQ